MRVMVIGRATKATETGVLADPEAFVAMGKFNEELIKAGILVDGGGLKPSSKGKRVRFSGKNRSVIDGPFTESKELIAGYSIWQVRSMEEAVEWVKRAPALSPEDTEVEIRPFYEAEDFGENLTPEAKVWKEQLQEKEAGQKK